MLRFNTKSLYNVINYRGDFVYISEISNNEHSYPVKGIVITYYRSIKAFDFYRDYYSIGGYEEREGISSPEDLFNVGSYEKIFLSL